MDIHTCIHLLILCLCLQGPAADVMNAAYTAAEVAARMIKPGNTNKQVCVCVSLSFWVSLCLCVHTYVCAIYVARVWATCIYDETYDVWPLAN